MLKSYLLANPRPDRQFVALQGLPPKVSDFSNGKLWNLVDSTTDSESCLGRVEIPHQAERVIVAAHKKSKFGSVREIGRGKQQATYKKNVEGVTRTYYAPRWFSSVTEANNWLANENYLIVNGLWTPPGTPDKKNTEVPTFEQYALKHIELQTTSTGLPLRESTKLKYTSYIYKQLAFFKDKQIDAITRQMVDEWWQEQMQTGKRTTASKAYKLMHAVFDRATDLEFGWVDATPCKVKGAQNAKTGVVTTAATVLELRQIAAKINPRYQVLLYVATFGGLRFGEVTALRRRDFVLHSDSHGVYFEITVTRQVLRLAGKWVVGPTKNEAGADVVRLHSGLTSMVKEYLTNLTSKAQDSLVFPSSSGTYLHNGVLAKEMKLAAVRCHLEARNITPHSLRRGGATEFANTNANLDEVKGFLRDKSTAAAIGYIKETNRKPSQIESMTNPLA
jgi:integrase